MSSVSMYLEGPGRERRAVTLLSSESVHLRPGSTDGIRIARRGAIRFQVRTLIDGYGNIAKQIDYDGYRYKFQGSELPWDLIVG